MKPWYGKLLLRYNQLNESQIKFLFVYNKSEIQSSFKRMVNND